MSWHSDRTTLVDRIENLSPEFVGEAALRTALVDRESAVQLATCINDKLLRTLLAGIQSLTFEYMEVHWCHCWLPVKRLKTGLRDVRCDFLFHLTQKCRSDLDTCMFSCEMQAWSKGEPILRERKGYRPGCAGQHVKQHLKGEYGTSKTENRGARGQ